MIQFKIEMTDRFLRWFNSFIAINTVYKSINIVY